MKKLATLVLLLFLFAIRESQTQTITTTGITNNITYVVGEYQVVSGAARTQFNLSQGHSASLIFGVCVYQNGLRLVPDAQYGRSGFTINLITPAPVGATVLFDYAFQ